MILFRDFWRDIITAQGPLLALGAPFIDPESFRTVLENYQIAIFLNIGKAKKGFVSPGGTRRLMDLASYESIPRALHDLKHQLAFERFDDSPLHASIRTFTSFVARARQHFLRMNFDEALIHYVIGLELIFGERNSIQRSMSERVALLTYHKAEKRFEQQQKWLMGIYDARSKYVHEGQHFTNMEDFRKLTSVCENVFRTLLRLQAAHSDRNKNVLAEWLRELDYLAKAVIADRIPETSQFREAFIEL